MRQQHPPLPKLTLEQLAAACRALDADADTGWQEVQIDPAVIEQRLKERGQALARLVAFLNGWSEGA